MKNYWLDKKKEVFFPIYTLTQMEAVEYWCKHGDPKKLPEPYQEIAQELTTTWQNDGWGE